MILFLSLPLAFLAFILESYPRFINREYGVDIWTHLLYLKEFHRQKGIPKRIENGFIVSGDYDYPPAFIWILSKFPFYLVKKYEFLFSPFFDSIHVVIIFTLSYLLTSNLLVALLTQLIYILTPIIILENSSATPRSVGYTLFTIVMMSLIFYQQTQNTWLIILAIISGSLIFLTHRFTTQGFLFFTVIFGIVEKSLLFPLIFSVSFIIASVASKGFYFKVLSGHIGNLYFWWKNIKYRYAHQVKGNLFPKNTKDYIFKLYTQFLKFPPFVLEITNPWLLFVFIFYYIAYPSDKIEQSLMIWVAVSYVLALSTMWVPSLRFLGEGQRYLELSAFPTAFLASIFFNKYIVSSSGMFLLFTYTVVSIASFVTILVIQRKAIINEKIRTLTPDMKKMFKYLKSLKNKPRLLCIPHQITTNTIYHTGCPVYVNASYATINKISDVYPYIRKPIAEIIKENNLQAVLVNTSYVALNELKIKNYKIIKEFDGFVLFKLN